MMDVAMPSFKKLLLKLKHWQLLILPPPSPSRLPKNNVEVTDHEVWLDSFWFRLNNIDHGGAREEAKAVTNSRKRH